MAFQKKMVLVFGLLLFFQNAKAQTHRVELEDALNEVYVNRNPFIEIDSSLQEVYKDTIQKVKKTILKTWHYQGIEKRKEGIYLDTLSWSSEGTIFVRNGDVFVLKNEIIAKTDSIAYSEFAFSKKDAPYNGAQIKEVVKKSLFGNTYIQKTCQPFYSIIYYQNEIGLYTSIDFRPIKYLSDKVLIIKTEYGLECYLKRE